MKKVALIACCIAFAASGAFAAEKQTKIGFVDVQKALNLSAAGKDAKSQLAARVKKYQDEINAKQEELKKLKDELEKQSVVLSESKKGEREKEYAQKLKDFQRFTKDAQEELQGKDEEFTRKILESFEKVVKEYATKNGYTFIFARNETMVFADEKADVTEDLIRQFDASRKK